MMWGARRIHTAVLNTSTVRTCRAERLNVPTQQTEGSDAPQSGKPSSSARTHAFLAALKCAAAHLRHFKGNYTSITGTEQSESQHFLLAATILEGHFLSDPKSDKSSRLNENESATFELRWQQRFNKHSNSKEAELKVK